jgi:hypothetical protein
LLAPSTHEQRVALLDGPRDEFDVLQPAGVARQLANRLLADAHAGGGA